ncbi:hypothetical protein HZS_7060 [Henneguya salminicola]|nr:hypothetical protein HZS_7060 [Henneguya salminicola]
MDNTIYKLLHIIIMLLNRINDYITESDFIDILNIACFSSRTQYLSDFSQTEVLILVAIARYCSNKDTYFFSDKIIINECYKILEDECIVFVNRDSITSAFSSLIDNHVIRPISCGQEPHCNNKYQMMYHEFEIKEMLKNNKNMSIFLSTLGKSNFIN